MLVMLNADRHLTASDRLARALANVLGRLEDRRAATDSAPSA